ncbi:hypothetical protein ACIA58_32665 [Kribbella sp. NPDC051586]|uniref:hypothetical protein n=1 Tax=Kribbella sp. NPDC051586 TaxID=3364118 RepID=UPI00378AA6A2
MRRTVATATVAVLLAAFQTTAAQAAPAPPTDVQVSWSDAATGLMRVTWTDAGASDKVRIEYQDGTVPTDWLPTAGNDFNHHWAVQWGKTARVAVVTTDATGDSAAAYSPWFDTNIPKPPTVTAAVPQADGSLRLTWTNSPDPKDSTPGDPLDVPVGKAGEVGVKVWTEPTDKQEWFPYPLGTTTAVVPPRPRPQSTRVIATNEWGGASPDEVYYTDMKFALRAGPAYGVFGKPMTISGIAGALLCDNPGNCGAGRLFGGAGIPITMQTRANAAKPWEYAGRYTSFDLYGFEARPVAVGGREYRFYAPAWKGYSMVTAMAISGAKYIPTLADFAVAGFNVRTAQVGQMVKLTVDVKPGGTVKGALQRWDGKYWRSVLTVPVVKGKATMSIRAAGRGTTTQYRVAVPGMTYYGLRIQTTGSRAFTLAVR